MAPREKPGKWVWPPKGCGGFRDCKSGGMQIFDMIKYTHIICKIELEFTR